LLSNSTFLHAIIASFCSIVQILLLSIFLKKDLISSSHSISSAIFLILLAFSSGKDLSHTNLLSHQNIVLASSNNSLIVDWCHLEFKTGISLITANFSSAVA
jgi:hypothetical protein